MTFQALYRRYASDMARVDDVMIRSIQSGNSVLARSSEQLMRAGGKRIRPLFALICSRVGHRDGLHQRVSFLAAALELIHMASLVHDDVIDDALLRRGMPTVRSQFGNLTAMYCGDFLFAKAIALLCKIDVPYVHQVMSDAMVRMCEGEIDQLGDFFNWGQTLRRYLRRIERKTALLIAASCELGALVGGTSPATAKQLGLFGYDTGMAFQIIDDVLDYIGEESMVGKPVGGDLRQGNITLPALRALFTGPAGSSLPSLIQNGMDDGQVREALSIVRDSDGIEYTKNLAQRYMQRAFRRLEAIDDLSVVSELTDVSTFLNQRLY